MTPSLITGTDSSPLLSPLAVLQAGTMGRDSAASGLAGRNILTLLGLTEMQVWSPLDDAQETG